MAGVSVPRSRRLRTWKLLTRRRSSSGDRGSEFLTALGGGRAPSVRPPAPRSPATPPRRPLEERSPWNRPPLVSTDGWSSESVDPHPRAGICKSPGHCSAGAPPRNRWPRSELHGTATGKRAVPESRPPAQPEVAGQSRAARAPIGRRWAAPRPTGSVPAPRHWAAAAGSPGDWPRWQAPPRPHWPQVLPPRPRDRPPRRLAAGWVGHVPRPPPPPPPRTRRQTPRPRPVPRAAQVRRSWLAPLAPSAERSLPRSAARPTWRRAAGGLAPWPERPGRGADGARSPPCPAGRAPRWTGAAAASASRRTTTGERSGADRAGRPRRPSGAVSALPRASGSRALGRGAGAGGPRSALGPRASRRSRRPSTERRPGVAPRPARGADVCPGKSAGPWRPHAGRAALGAGRCEPRADPWRSGFPEFPRRPRWRSQPGEASGPRRRPGAEPPAAERGGRRALGWGALRAVPPGPDLSDADPPRGRDPICLAAKRGKGRPPPATVAGSAARLAAGRPVGMEGAAPRARRRRCSGRTRHLRCFLLPRCRPPGVRESDLAAVKACAARWGWGERNADPMLRASLAAWLEWHPQISGSARGALPGGSSRPGGTSGS